MSPVSITQVQLRYCQECALPIRYTTFQRGGPESVTWLHESTMERLLARCLGLGISLIHQARPD